MNQAELKAYTDLVQLHADLSPQQRDRKLLLFGVACCRKMWPLLPQPEMRAAVEMAERFADGMATREQLGAADYRLEGALYGGIEYYAYRPELAPPDEIAHWASDLHVMPSDALAAMACCGGEALPNDMLGLLKDAAYFADHVASMQGWDTYSLLLRHYGRFINRRLAMDVLGDPSQPAPVSASWFAWNDGAIRKMAQTVYDDRVFDRLPLLADALEDAGCDDAAILAHCREPGEHVRGCWVVDLLLGKK